MQSLAPTLQVLESLTSSTEAELASIYRELQQADVNLHKLKVSGFLQAFSTIIERLLVGTVIGDPEKLGQTLQEEKTHSGTHSSASFSIEPYLKTSVQVLESGQTSPYHQKFLTKILKFTVVPNLSAS